MKRRVSPVLIAMLLLGALAAEAHAGSSHQSLTVASGKAAIARFARGLTYEIADAGSALPMSWQVSACARRQADVVCTGEWLLAGENCSVRMEALKGKFAIRVRKLGRPQCTREGNGELN
jgi:hypothetical protein